MIRVPQCVRDLAGWFGAMAAWYCVAGVIVGTAIFLSFGIRWNLIFNR